MLVQSMNLRFLAPLGVLAVSVASAQSSKGIEFGPTTGLYYPIDSKVRDLFGSGFRFSLSPTSGDIPTELKWLPSISAISDSKDGNKFFLFPVTASYVRHLSAVVDQRVVPYIKFSVGAAYYDYSLQYAPGDRRSKKTVGYTTGLEFGVRVSRLITGYAKYNYFSKSDGLDFSGVSLGLEFNLFRL